MWLAGSNACAEFSPVDIQSACNMAFKDNVDGDKKGGWTDQGQNDLRNFPIGSLNFCGIPFEIIDPVKNNDHSCIVLSGEPRSYFPTGVSIKKVGSSANTIYFLHTMAWNAEPRREVFRYLVRYEDGSQKIILIRSGLEVGPWWNPRKVSHAEVAWEGKNPVTASVGIFIYTWENPLPTTVIKEIDIISANTTAVPCVVAITLSDKPKQAFIPFKQMSLKNDTRDWFSFPIPEVLPGGTAIDLSDRLDPPAGKHGKLTVKDGVFYFEDGTRARFWGYAVSTFDLASTHPRAIATADRLANLGCNFVKLMCPMWPFGNRWLWSGTPGPECLTTLDPNALDRFDFFLYQLKKRGIYVHFDGFGQYATPFIKGRKEIERYKNFINVWLNHRNPYTGLKYKDDPAICMAYIINEAAFYDAGMNKQWNQWLLKKYGNRESLKKAWTDINGKTSLKDEEDPAKGNVGKPTLSSGLVTWDRDYEKDKSPARVNDALLGLSEIMLAYFQEIKDLLHSMDARMLITGNNYNLLAGPQNTWVNTHMDFIANHLYWGGGGFKNVDGSWPVNNGTFLNMTPLNSWCVLSIQGASKVRGCPSFIGEIDIHHYPNEKRCMDYLYGASYGALQDWDGFTWWGYTNKWTESRKRDKQTYFFDCAIDIPKAAMMPASSLIYLRGDVSKSRNTVDVGYSYVDTFYGQSAFHPYEISKTPFSFLTYLSRCGINYFSEQFDDNADIVIASGRSATGDYRKAKHAIVYSDNPYQDLYNKKIGREHPALLIYPQLKFKKFNKAVLNFEGLIFPMADLEIANVLLVEVSSIPENSKVLGVTCNGEYALGFINERYLICPHLSAPVSGAKSSLLYHVFINCAVYWNVPGFNREQINKPVMVSDTGELKWDYTQGIFTVNTPRSQGVTGFIGKKEIVLKNVSFEAPNEFCTIVLTSLDDKPINVSDHMLLTTVARAENTGSVWSQDKTKLLKEGTAPLLTEPVYANISIDTMKKLNVWALNADGTRKSNVPFRYDRNKLIFETGKHRTVWYELAGRRYEKQSITWPQVSLDPDVVKGNKIMLEPGSRTFQTIQQAVNAIPQKVDKPYVITVGPGKYYQYPLTNLWIVDIRNKKTSPENTITIRAVPVHAARIDGAAEDAGGIRIENTSYVTIEGFTVNSQNINITGNSSYVTIRNCVLDRIPAYGATRSGSGAIVAGGNTSHIIVENCKRIIHEYLYKKIIEKYKGGYPLKFAVLNGQNSRSINNNIIYE